MHSYLTQEKHRPDSYATMRWAGYLVHAQGSSPSEKFRRFRSMLGELDRRGPTPETPPHSHEHFETSEWNPERGIACAAIEEHLSGADLLRAKGFLPRGAACKGRACGQARIVFACEGAEGGEEGFSVEEERP